MRLQYQTNVKSIKVPCTGRIDVIYLRKALEQGAACVFISGCLLEDCLYISGNCRTRKHIAYVKDLLVQIGMSPEMVKKSNSAGMGPQFAQCCRDFTDHIRKLGSGLRGMMNTQ